MFFIYSTATVVVTLLLISGTGYDLILRSRSKKTIKMKKYSKDLTSDSSSGFGCTTYDLTQVIPEKSNKPNCDMFGVPTGLNNNNSDENLAIEPVSPREEKLSSTDQTTLTLSAHLFFYYRCLVRIVTILFSCN